MNAWLRDIGRTLILAAKVGAWSVVVLVFAYCGFTVWLNSYDGGYTKEDAAVQQIMQLEGACKNYMAKNRGDPPQSLDALVAPFNGGSPLVEGGPNALIDPWNKPYQYDPTHVDQRGNLDQLVTTTNSNGEPLYSPKRRAGR